MLFALASLLPDYPVLGETLRFQLVGFAIVLLVLSSLWLLIRLVGMGFLKAAERAKPVPSLTPAASVGAASSPRPEIVAAIAAAVHTVVREPHRIVSIHPASSSFSGININAWSVEGRRQIFSSHSLR